MDENAAMEVASAVQFTSINRHPDPDHDMNPSTTASQKTPVHFEPAAHRRGSRASIDTTQSDSSPAALHTSQSIARPSHHHAPAGTRSTDEIPISALQPVARRTTMPPLPDMRFEQSYLARIAGCESGAAVAWVTLKDQVLMPLAQGVGWSLAVHGWRAWNTAAAFSGQGVGAKIRRWWWGVNEWALPGQTPRGER